jgi:hypothetical protein
MPESAAVPGEPLTPDESEALLWLADQLIPARHQMPGASSAAGFREWLGRALAVRRDLLPAVREAIARGRTDDPAVAVRDLRENDPDSFLTVVTVVASAYYMNPAVRRLIGYPGQEPTLASPAEDGLGDDILGPVRTWARKDA